MKEHEKSFQILFAEFFDLILISIHATKAMVITRHGTGWMKLNFLRQKSKQKPRGKSLIRSRE